MTNFLNKEGREPKTLILHKHAVLKVTENLPDQNISQGHLCLLLDIQTENATSFVAKLVPPNFDVSSNGFDPSVFDTWRSVIIQRRVGYAHSFCGDTVRRTQYTVSNYVSSTVHKLMGDTFECLAPSISLSDGPYSIWLT